VSKNIENDEERKRLSEIMRRIADSKMLGTKGCIVRTEAEGATEEVPRPTGEVVLAEAMNERTNTTRRAAFFMGMVLSNVVKSILS